MKLQAGSMLLPALLILSLLAGCITPTQNETAAGEDPPSDDPGEVPEHHHSEVPDHQHPSKAELFEQSVIVSPEDDDTIGTSSTTWQQMPDMELTFQTEGGPFLLIFDASRCGPEGDEGSDSALWRMVLDGEPIGFASVYNPSGPSHNTLVPVTIHRTATLDSGAHTLRIDWMSHKGSDVWCPNRAGETGGQRTLIAAGLG